ncbi:MAG TPA: TIGR03088 family PEP-CTERM/XrtA system glycosyltransferase [Woeseiaceae bacterium]|nr:TIGR03088 family PEP-CTERM/XrtA system glycosyltransferase [Woeseiaceae bacterium]
MSRLAGDSDAGKADASRPLIAHVVFRFDYGGLENGLVNLINRMPEERFRHSVVALTEATAFRDRLQRPDVEVHALGKRPGKDPRAYWQLYRLLRRLKPAVLHTRNIGTLDCALLGRAAGIRACVHGEHGWDTHDPDGTSRKYRRLRRLMCPLVSRFITVSQDLRQWLIEPVGVPAGKITRICNGVDTERFHPCSIGERAPELAERFGTQRVIVGSVLRFNEIKDPLNLVRAFIVARREAKKQGMSPALVMVGDGPLREAAIAALNAAGVSDACWLPGRRDDVPAIMRSLDLFVLGSRREGISNTVLEAMASGLPAIATETGGNRELVTPETGTLVRTEDSAALAEAILRYARDPVLRHRQGGAAREAATAQYSLRAMVDGYRQVYEDLAGPAPRRPKRHGHYAAEH